MCMYMYAPVVKASGMAKADEIAETLASAGAETFFFGAISHNCLKDPDKKYK